VSRGRAVSRALREEGQEKTNLELDHAREALVLRVVDELRAQSKLEGGSSGSLVLAALSLGVL
jgi:hypothetical protein